MFTRDRFDGTYIRNLNFFTQITPYVKPARTDSVIVFKQEYDVTRTMEFLHAKNTSFTQVFLYAALRTITIMPKINRFVSGLRFYQRNRIAFSFNKPNTTAGDANSQVTISFSPLLTFESFCQKIQDYISPFDKFDKDGNQNKLDKILTQIKKLPRFLIKFLIWGVKFLDYHNALHVSFTNSLPYYSTLILTNTENINIDATYYHNFDIGTCGIFCTIGKSYIDNDREKVKLTFTFDNRVTDTDYCVQALELLRDLTENPEKLETPPEWTTEQLVRLGLSEKELNNI